MFLYEHSFLCEINKLLICKICLKIMLSIYMSRLSTPPPQNPTTPQQICSLTSFDAPCKAASERTLRGCDVPTHNLVLSIIHKCCANNLHVVCRFAACRYGAGKQPANSISNASLKSQF